MVDSDENYKFDLGVKGVIVSTYSKPTPIIIDIIGFKKHSYKERFYLYCFDHGLRKKI